MNIRKRAFRIIQKYPHLYSLWCNAKTESERTGMLVEMAYSLGMDDGWAKAEKEFINSGDFFIDNRI